MHPQAKGLARSAPPLRAAPITLTYPPPLTLALRARAILTLTLALTLTPLPGAILADGFRLPSHAGMFGRGIYFADTPLKSLQYTGGTFGCVGGGRRYMLVCDVELGNPLETTSAN